MNKPGQARSGQAWPGLFINWTTDMQVNYSGQFVSHNTVVTCVTTKELKVVIHTIMVLCVAIQALTV